MGLGINVMDTGLSTTPTVEMAVTFENADGGIIPRCHNPKQWNALKLLNEKGEFLSRRWRASAKDREDDAYTFNEVDSLGTEMDAPDHVQMHIDVILRLPYVDAESIKKLNPHV